MNHIPYSMFKKLSRDMENIKKDPNQTYRDENYNV